MSVGKDIPSGKRRSSLTAVQPERPGFQLCRTGGAREEPVRILVIAASEADCLLIGSHLEQRDFPALFASALNGEELQRATNAGDWDVVLLDLAVRSLNLSEVIDRIRSRMPSVPVILLSAGSDEGAAGLLAQGASDLVYKDHMDALVPAIDGSLRKFFLLHRSANGRISGGCGKRLGLALTATGMGIWEWDLNARAVSFSPECLEILGSQNVGPALDSFMKLVHPGDRERFMAEARQALDTGTVCRSEFRVFRPDGEERWLLSLGKGDYDEQGNVLSLVSSLQDITGRKKTEERLQSSLTIWNTTFDAINDAIGVRDTEGVVQRANRAMVDLTNSYPQAGSDHPCWKDRTGADAPFPDCPFSRMLTSRRRESMMVQRLDRWFNIVADPVIDRANALIGGVQIIADVTEYKQFEQRLRESEGKFRSLAEQSLVGTYILQDDRLKYVNLRFAEIFGYRPEDVTGGMSLQDLIVPEDRDFVGANVRHCASNRLPTVHNEFRGLKRTGDTISAEVFGSRAVYLGRPAVIGIVLDVTEKTKLEQQLRQAQKMEAVGQLTSGIAHDFNNILSAIIGYASLLQMKVNPDGPARGFVEQILTSADRAATLIRSLLTFSRKQITDLRVIDINELIAKAGKLLRVITGANVDVRVAAAGRLVVNADPGQIEQVLMNLATNAADAMPRGGILSIETGVATSDALDTANGKLHERYAVITVTDTGAGMEEQTREKIFEPFFTTKDVGRGTGLGLSMVYGIIRQHNGHIRCDSRPGAGTRFTIYLPLLRLCDGAGEADAGALPVQTEPPQGTETVLVAEGDASMMSLAKTTLEAFGYTVIGAADGKEALERFLLHREAVQLILSNVALPGMSGAELENAIRADAPDLPILFMSGYPGDIVYRKSLIDRAAELISKPFSPGLLLQKIRDMLNGKKTEKHGDKGKTDLPQ